MALNDNPLDVARAATHSALQRIARLVEDNDELRAENERLRSEVNQPSPQHQDLRSLLHRAAELLEALDREVNEDKQTGEYDPDGLITEIRSKLRG
jgi:regulator of replication initiation timing